MARDVQPRMNPIHLCGAATIALCLLIASPASAEGPRVNKPLPGVGGGNVDPAQAAREQARRNKEAAEQAEHQAHIAREQARERGDLARAAFEKAHRPGPVAEKDRGAFEAAVGEYKQAIALDPDGEIGSYCRQRLAGAYTYVGNFDEAGHVLADAVTKARGAEDQIRALQSLALHELQARHRPAEALPWARAMQTAAETFTDPSMQAKWRAAAAEMVAQCEATLGAAGKRK